MNKNELLFYDAYEDFYKMASSSDAFRSFCKDAFGEDFSQDGFSDLEQINRILKWIPEKEDVHVLDIGCGNGKMLGYLKEKTGCNIHGFDYSDNAISSAKEKYGENADFRVGIIGEIEYEPESFDLITSMDTMYFAKDMEAFVGQVWRWLKKDGVFFVAYQEGDVMQKTETEKTTVLAQALIKHGLSYEVENITAQTYEMLKKKREAAMKHKKEFEAENNMNWYDMLMWQTDCAQEEYNLFAKKMARYIYIIRK